jgi:hypothetical protein
MLAVWWRKGEEGAEASQHCRRRRMFKLSLLDSLSLRGGSEEEEEADSMHNS